ncbi:hypothetical protein MRS76_13475 [Rhizobiaceae bacterium n13]|uniref:Uncharacterized protein n=1 Tax=Ferirhizobium litorale TaxID=2927786 RepID=A0AAE3U2Y2_9HYPH|nr:hypothetical protein [Fererhizobium litorale]MDI7862968.1 hypothetical protein [Fererhizobium litorale]MDI7924041.1 hypothetical protein [Fererhizobium litorale]
MLVPLQQSSAMFAADALRSMLEEIEARRQEAEEEAKGTEKDRTFPGITYDQRTIAAREKIEAYFFGALKKEADPMVALIARFSAALGVTQGVEESSAAFARRLNDALTTTANFAKADALGNPVKISLVSLGVSADEVRSLLDGTAVGEQDPMAELAARIAIGAGLSGEEDDFEIQISRALMTARSKLPENVASLEKATGLKELGLTATDMIAAIANPWSETAQKVKDALSEQAKGEKSMTHGMLKIIQRLEDVADPKTLEELQREEAAPEPGHIEDEETKAERKRDILKLENSDKLEDVLKLQEAVKEHLDKAGEHSDRGETQSSVASDVQAIQLLSALADGSETAKSPRKADQPLSEAAPGTIADGELAEVAGAEDDDRDLVDIFGLYVDENGIFELFLRNAA